MNSNSKELLFIFVPEFKILLQRYFSSISFHSTDSVCIAGGSGGIRESSTRIGKHLGVSGSSEKRRSSTASAGELNSVKRPGDHSKIVAVCCNDRQRGGDRSNGYLKAVVR